MYTWTLPSSLATPVAMGAPTNRSDRPSAFRSTAHTLAPKYEPSFQTKTRVQSESSISSDWRTPTPSSASLPLLPTPRRRRAAGAGRSQRHKPAGETHTDIAMDRKVHNQQLGRAWRGRTGSVSYLSSLVVLRSSAHHLHRRTAQKVTSSNWVTWATSAQRTECYSQINVVINHD